MNPSRLSIREKKSEIDKLFGRLLVAADKTNLSKAGEHYLTFGKRCSTSSVHMTYLNTKPQQVVSVLPMFCYNYLSLYWN